MVDWLVSAVTWVIRWLLVKPLLFIIKALRHDIQRIARRWRRRVTRSRGVVQAEVQRRVSARKGGPPPPSQ